MLVAAWKRDRVAWGLRGYEQEYPDADKLRKEIDSRGAREGSPSTGLVASGLLSRVRERIYHLTPAGLAAAAEVVGAEPDARGKAERVLADAVHTILSHSVFRAWMKDSNSPKHFRDAGHLAAAGSRYLGAGILIVNENMAVTGTLFFPSVQLDT